jgi:hypothetical protein
VEGSDPGRAIVDSVPDSEAANGMLGEALERTIGAIVNPFWHSGADSETDERRFREAVAWLYGAFANPFRYLLIAERGIGM